MLGELSPPVYLAKSRGTILPQKQLWGRAKLERVQQSLYHVMHSMSVSL